MNLVELLEQALILNTDVVRASYEEDSDLLKKLSDQQEYCLHRALMLANSKENES